MIKIKIPRITRYRLEHKWKRYQKIFVRQAESLSDAAIAHGVQLAIEQMASFHAIDTGMSAASTLPLFDKFDMTFAKQYTSTFLDYIESAAKTPDGRKGYGNPWDPNAERSMDEGLAMGADVRYKKFTVYRPYMTFSFDIKVYQWKRWEDNWQAVDTMMIGIEQFFTNNLTQYIKERDLVDLLTPEFTNG